MKNPLLFAALVAVCLLPFSTRAQQPSPSPADTENKANFPVWTAELPGGKYEVALRSILAVSSHDYLVDGAARVTEVNIATSSPMVVRFYYVETITPQSPVGIGQSTINQVAEKVEALADRTGMEPVWKRVVKSYPTSTHAHTVEYRLDNKDQLKKLFDSVELAWKRNRPATFKAE